MRHDDFDRVRDYLTGLQDRICAAIEAADGGARFVEDAWQRDGRRRRAHADPARRRRVRAGRRRVLRCLRHDAAAVGQRGAAGARRRVVARGRRLAGVPSAQPLRADHARQRAPLPRDARRRDGGVVVRRRLRPHAVLPVRRGRAALAPHRARAVRAVRRRDALRGAQALVRRVLLPQAPQRDARRRRPVLRRPARRTSSATSPTCARSATASSTPTCRSSSAAATRPTASASASSSCTGAAATSSSTWCTTAARCSACRPAGAPNRS